jgi:hypothetical protein
MHRVHGRSSTTIVRTLTLKREDRLRIIREWKRNRKTQTITGADSDWYLLAATAVASFAFWLLVSMGIQYVATTGSRWWSEYREHSVRSARAVANLDYLTGNEAVALNWIYHRHGRRFRGNLDFDVLDQLVEHGILEVEDPNRRTHDTFLVVPRRVFEVLATRLGARKPNSVDNQPPWLTWSRI